MVCVYDITDLQVGNAFQGILIFAPRRSSRHDLNKILCTFYRFHKYLIAFDIKKKKGEREMNDHIVIGDYQSWEGFNHLNT